jgi:hypothetical protein
LQPARLVHAAPTDGTDAFLDIEELGALPPALPWRRDRDDVLFERPSAGAGPES